MRQQQANLKLRENVQQQRQAAAGTPPVLAQPAAEGAAAPNTSAATPVMETVPSTVAAGGNVPRRLRAVRASRWQSVAAALQGGGSSGSGAAARLRGAARAPAVVPPPAVGGFQYQLAEPFDAARHLVPGVAVYGIDGADNGAAAVAAIKAAGGYPICYFSTSFEDWRTDAAAFPAAALGRPLGDWPGERWADVRSPAVRAVARKRLEMCAAKGFPAAEADNVDIGAASGFPIGAAERADFVRYLADTAHGLGLAFGLKNTLAQAKDLVGAVDFAINEQCSEYNECGLYRPFRAAGKPVFNVEYDQRAFERLCPKAAALGLRPVLKSQDLKAGPRTACPGES